MIQEKVSLSACVCVPQSMGGHTHFHPAAPARSMALLRLPPPLARPPDRHTARRLTLCPTLPESAARGLLQFLCSTRCCCWSASRENVRPRIRNSPQRLYADTATARPPCAHQQLASKPICALFYLSERALAHTARAPSPQPHEGLSL